MPWHKGARQVVYRIITGSEIHADSVKLDEPVGNDETQRRYSEVLEAVKTSRANRLAQ